MEHRADSSDGVRVQRHLMRRNGINLNGKWYDAPELARLFGRTVFVHCDPANIDMVDVCDASGRLFCVARTRKSIEPTPEAELGQAMAFEKRRLSKVQR